MEKYFKKKLKKEEKKNAEEALRTIRVELLGDPDRSFIRALMGEGQNTAHPISEFTLIMGEGLSTIIKINRVPDEFTNNLEKAPKSVGLVLQEAKVIIIPFNLDIFVAAWRTALNAKKDDSPCSQHQSHIQLFFDNFKYINCKWRLPPYRVIFHYTPLFLEMLHNSPMHLQFPEYKGDNSIQSITDFLTNKVRQLNGAPRVYYSFLPKEKMTTENARKEFYDACKWILLDANLEAFGVNVDKIS